MTYFVTHLSDGTVFKAAKRPLTLFIATTHKVAALCDVTNGTMTTPSAVVLALHPDAAFFSPHSKDVRPNKHQFSKRETVNF